MEDKKFHELKENIAELITEYGWIDGAHHKQWVLTQILKLVVSEKEFDEIMEDWDGGIKP